MQIVIDNKYDAINYFVPMKPFSLFLSVFTEMLKNIVWSHAKSIVAEFEFASQAQLFYFKYFLNYLYFTPYHCVYTAILY